MIQHRGPYPLDHPPDIVDQRADLCARECQHLRRPLRSTVDETPGCVDLHANRRQPRTETIVQLGADPATFGIGGVDGVMQRSAQHRSQTPDPIAQDHDRDDGDVDRREGLGEHLTVLTAAGDGGGNDQTGHDDDDDEPDRSAFTLAAATKEDDERDDTSDRTERQQRDCNRPATSASDDEAVGSVSIAAATRPRPPAIIEMTRYRPTEERADQTERMSAAAVTESSSTKRSRSLDVWWVFI